MILDFSLFTMLKVKAHCSQHTLSFTSGQRKKSLVRRSSSGLINHDVWIDWSITMKFLLIWWENKSIFGFQCLNKPDKWLYQSRCLLFFCSLSCRNKYVINLTIWNIHFKCRKINHNIYLESLIIISILIFLFPHKFYLAQRESGNFYFFFR